MRRLPNSSLNYQICLKPIDPNEAATLAKTRAQISESLGRAGEAHRKRIYTQDFGGVVEISKTNIEDFIVHALDHIDASISVNLRHDHMIHSYNLITIEEDQIIIKNLGFNAGRSGCPFK